MEEVWKDISLSTLHQDLEAKPTSTNPFRGIVLQDLLAGDFNEPPPVSAPLNDLPLPRFTGLSLNSGRLMVHPNSSNSNTNGGASSAGPFAYCSKKRALERQPEASFGHGHGNGADRRKKRMIKNRESAARSRARKQAYTYELQREVARLLDENRKLKRTFEELRLAMEAQVPAKRTLQRTSTAPF
ncbi:bZIP transcription factor 27 [Cocos nucifera]|uniref:BZIP transcription factor 27 n=1 Tax=Cocos nucifera TaxID=13894 RepID=A0A8K0N709_COCNU|nr:bZIP transcription factor 27 [Cocos nucifera]